MATVHNTTLAPSKLELLTAWLPGQPWYLDAGLTPQLTRAGGFRLDDPAGEVGIEFMIVTDAAGGGPVSYHVPMTYRAQAQPGSEAGLIGTTEHGVLGTRYVYDATHDWVFVTQLVALMQGQTEPQAQSLSDTPDPTVRSQPVLPGSSLVVTACALASNGPDGTRLRISTADTASTADGDGDGEPTDLLLRVIRALPVRPGAADQRGGYVQVPWRQADGTEPSGVIVTAAPAVE
ncbi:MULTISPECIES: maltokinase N-terminal cap-like domain-containing protein [unclassified Pseudofrankia]|uniref:maltokinase N-terminal cap-like domain-containing protein n=1 Tax=unclassified Pseudofrankia TaxID=2994372 RepID=UPI0008D9BC8B|nr:MULTISPECIES: 1,4-alpha-glucan branching protein [unclassified Pseudofrankia]MDT3439395.1 1,4-alpha-glucan branching protein [Pseudofrankia sp. BMG5.37]OHV65022.1 1,4-alpha-glucan branching protein [Pseudofrankia sp. BMG5.36]